MTIVCAPVSYISRYRYIMERLAESGHGANEFDDGEGDD